MAYPHIDFEQENQANRYRHRLDDIRDWLAELTDTITTITSPRLSHAPGGNGEARLPGGDALVMLGPWAADADHGDGIPHPAMICHEWVERIQGHARHTFTENWRWLRDNTPHILQSPFAEAWRADIDALWTKLGHLTGNHQPPEPQPVNLIARAMSIPDTATMTAAEANHFFPGIAQKLKDDRHHGRPTPTPAEGGKYTGYDIKEYATERGCIHPKTMAT